MVRPYVPYSRSYSQVAATAPLSSRASDSHSLPRTSPPSSRPPTPPLSKSLSPPLTQGVRYYSSPTSPTSLPFPPAASYPEWRNRCFRCFRTGHAASKCCNPVKCGKCWMEGHVLSKCKVSLNSTAQPFIPAHVPLTTPRDIGLNGSQTGVPQPKPVVCPTAAPSNTHEHLEPSFDDLLKGTGPPTALPFPEDRPEKLQVFIERDQDFYNEIQRLSKAVVIHGE